MRGGLALIALLLLHASAARAQPAAPWLGDWREQGGPRHLKISATTLVESTQTGAHIYHWTNQRFVNICDAMGWKVKPGEYFGYDKTSLDVGGIKAIVSKAWGEIGNERHTKEATSAYQAVLQAIGKITPGTYRRLRRFCVQAPDAPADCNEPDQDSFLILDGDHVVELVLFQVAPEESEIHQFRH